MTRLCAIGLLGVSLALPILSAAPKAGSLRASEQAPAAASGVIAKGDFRFAYDERGVSILANPNDPFRATLTTPPAAARGGRAGGATAQPAAAATLGLVISYRAAGASYRASGAADWSNLPRGGSMTASPADAVVTYTTADLASPLKVRESYKTDGRALDWSIDLEAAGKTPVEIGDLGISIPVQGPNGATPADIFERGFLKHQFVSGAGSFFFYVRASGAPPFLLVTVKPGTKLEYTGTTGQGATGAARGPAAQVYVHSLRAATAESRGTWRQPNTSLTLAAAGRAGSKASYGFRMQWASSYDEMRRLIYDAGLFDVRVVPGMTIPDNLAARFSLHTKARIESVTGEFPSQTTITELTTDGPWHAEAPSAKAADTRVYEVAFKKLGENTLTITHDGGRKTYLEFFVTEPLETLIKKRAAFLVNRQQIKDPGKWWNGVYGIYDARAKIVRTIDDPDIFLDRMVYALTCDDPGLAKAPYLASKNVTFPDKKEIESLEYYIKNFVWGGLQRRDDERPYPYGVYGTPNWYVNRDPQRRLDYAKKLTNGATAIADMNKEHVWRSYDYPHVVMLYFHMYQIAKLYPEMTTYLDAAGYLNRAWETAKAFYTYPYEIYPSYYDTYKWGLYNELIVLDVMNALEREGFPQQAATLRHQWEIKTKYFVYDDPYPFRSEYAFDRTAFESTYAFAKYGATHEMAPDENLWFNLKLKKWWSHPSVKREDSRAFMDRQLASGLVVRGWLNPAYYTLGSDAGMSYMAAMGGWGVLDYGLNFAPRPAEWLQLGYASYLSSWALMNTGRPDTNYGFWFPGPENDGAAGWQFISTKVGSAWMGSSFPGGVTEPRGPWHYDGEIDLGFGGALRMAATIVTKDPTFGWFAYGASMTDAGAAVSVVPRDGLRRRFDIVVPDRALPFAEDTTRFKLELERDGFAAESPIVVDKALGSISFTIENRTGSAHSTGVKLSLPVNARYQVTQDGKAVPLTQTGNWDYPWRAELTMGAASTRRLRFGGRPVFEMTRLAANFAHDLRYALRVLRQNRGLTAVAVLSLALGIGGNTAIFSVVDGLMLRALPVREPDRLILVDGSVRYSMFEKLRDATPELADLTAVVRTDRYNVGLPASAAGEPAIDSGPVRVALASGHYFRAMGLETTVGRAFDDHDDRAGAQPVAVISDAYRRRRFHDGPDVLGRRLIVSGTSYEIVGVMPSGFGGEWVGRPADVWIPIVWQPTVMIEIPTGGLANIAVTAIGRLAPRVQPAQVQTAWQTVLTNVRLAEAGPSPTPKLLAQIAQEKILVMSGARGMSPQRDVFGESLWILMSAVGAVLLVACANVASLLLSRAEARRREMAVRCAIGASRGRLIGQLLTESFLLAAISAVAGVVLARWATSALMALVRSSPSTNAGATLAVNLDVSLDLRVLAFTAAVCVLSALVFGLAAAFRGSSAALSPALMGRGADERRSARGKFAIGKGLVILQVALSLVLVGGAGLLARTLRNLSSEELGFDRERLLLVWTLPGQTGGRGAGAANFWQDAIARVATIPGVVAVSASNQGVLNGSDLTGLGSGTGLRIESEPQLAAGLPGLRSFIAPGFFKAMGIPMLAGRDFSEADTATATRGVVISQAMARHYFGDRDPIGHRIWFQEDTAEPTTIIGVVGDFLIGGPREVARRPGFTYFSYRDREASRRLRSMMMVVRTAGDPAGLTNRTRAELQAAPLVLPVLRIDTVDEQLADVLVQERLVAAISGVFGVLSLVLAAMGLYGVVSYGVAQRTNEIGIRMALGATRQGVLRQILRESLLLVVAGTAVGVPALILLARFMASRLFGVTPGDPVTIATTLALMIAITTIAATVPAYRASTVNPLTALRRD